MKTEVRLGIEELCLALSLMDEPEVAKGLLYVTFDEISPDEERGRLLAAGHSLMSRDLLCVKNGRSYLADEFRELVSILVDSDFSIHCNRKVAGFEFTLAYYVKDKMVLEI